MTSNEKKVLMKFSEIKQGNTVTMAGTLRVTISYAYDVCKKLCEKGYLEELSPGRFALYKITSLGEEQVKTDVQTKEEGATESLDSSRGEGVLQRSEVPGGDDSVGRKVKIEKYECSNCGVIVREDEIECPKCGIIFEGTMKEKEAAKQSKEVPQPASQSSERSEKNVLDEPSVPEDWKICNWKWK